MLIDTRRYAAARDQESGGVIRNSFCILVGIPDTDGEREGDILL